ncbi:MAG TPA: HlyD family secretion protein [Gemmataceae bacterium]
MSTPATPRRGRHLQVFALSLVVILLALTGFLFGVRMEATAPAKGVVTARDLLEIRTRFAGLIEPGWCEPAESAGAPSNERPFHRLRAGDEVAAGQVIALLYPGEEGGAGVAVRAREPIPRRAPETAERWLVLEVPVAHGQAVPAGTLIATLAPLDPQTGQVRDLMVRLDVREENFGEVAPGQPVRLRSAMYPERTHGVAEAVIDRLEPAGEPAPDGGRVFHAWAAVTASPFPLRIGSGVDAEIVLGRKRTYRIILEH